MLALKEFKVNVIMPIGGIYPLVTIFILILTGTEVISGFVLIGTLLIIVGVSLVTRYGSNDGKKPVSKKAVLFGLGSAVCWGSSVFLVRQVLNSPGSDPTSLTGFRMLMLGLLSVSIYYFLRNGNEKIDTGTKQDKRKTIIYLGLSGIVGWVIGATIFFVAVQNIGASIPTPISSLNPIVAVIIGYIFKIEAINKKQFLGVLTSVLGTIVIVL